MQSPPICLLKAPVIEVGLVSWNQINSLDELAVSKDIVLSTWVNKEPGSSDFVLHPEDCVWHCP